VWPPPPPIITPEPPPSPSPPPPPPPPSSQLPQAKAPTAAEWDAHFPPPAAPSAQPPATAAMAVAAAAAAARAAAPAIPPPMSTRATSAAQLSSATGAEWQIPLSELAMGARIGSGAFGEVVRAVYQGTDVAVKRMNTGASGALGDFVREVQLLTRLRHPHVVLFMGAAVSAHELCIVMEFASNGSLWAVLHGRNKAVCDARRRLQWAAETAKGMAYLHSRSPPIVHRDLKSGNLLVDEDWHIKVSDFGLAKTKSLDGAGARSQVGTYAWMAPEVLQQRPYDERADVYSYSIVLWEMLCKVEPFKGLHPMQVMWAVDKGERPPLPPLPDCPPDYVALIRSCWAREPEERPSFKEALQRLSAMATGQWR